MKKPRRLKLPPWSKFILSGGAPPKDLFFGQDQFLYQMQHGGLNAAFQAIDRAYMVAAHQLNVFRRRLGGITWTTPVKITVLPCTGTPEIRVTFLDAGP